MGRIIRGWSQTTPANAPAPEPPKHIWGNQQRRPGRRGPLPGSAEQIARVIVGVAVVALLVISTAGITLALAR